MDNNISLDRLLHDYQQLLNRTLTPVEVTSILTRFKLETVKWFFKKGYSERAAANQVGVSHQAVNYWRKKLGLVIEEK